MMPNEPLPHAIGQQRGRARGRPRGGRNNLGGGRGRGQGRGDAHPMEDHNAEANNQEQVRPTIRLVNLAHLNKCVFCM